MEKKILVQLKTHIYGGLGRPICCPRRNLLLSEMLHLALIMSCVLCLCVRRLLLIDISEITKSIADIFKFVI